MKKLLLALLIAAIGLAANAQVYDGITQPSKYRVFVPVTIANDANHKTTIAPFVGYKQDLSSHWSVTGIAQYNINAEDFQVAAWFNYTPDHKFYVLSRNILDTKSGEFRETLSATYKLPLNFMIDGTWDNLYNGKKFCDTDRLQFVGGWAHKFFVVNAGYSCRNAKGFIANLRLKITPLNWLQLKYDGGMKNIQVSTALQFN